MTPKEELEIYLAEKPDKRDYTVGFNLFCKYSRQLSVQSHLARKEDPERLFYKLEQLLEQPDIAESKTPRIPVIVQAQTKTEVNEAETRLKAVSKGRINPEDLPEELKPLYFDISDAHKKSRSFHEKMKLAQTEKARAGIRKGLLNLEDFIRNGWAILDHYVLTGELPVKEEKTEVTAKDIAAAGTFLSRGLKMLETVAEDKKPELVAKLKVRYDILLSAKREFDPKTIEALTKHGVINESGTVSN